MNFFLVTGTYVELIFPNFILKHPHQQKKAKKEVKSKKKLLKVFLENNDLIALRNSLWY